LGEREEWIVPSSYGFLNFLVRIVGTIVFRWAVVDAGNLPSHGPVILVSNHLNIADPPLIGGSLRRPVVFMAKSELYRSPFVAALIRGYGAFPVRRGEADRAAFKTSLEVLRRGQVLGLFPEGHRSLDHKLQKGLSGVALIAVRSGAAIVPVAVTGSEKLSWRKLWSRPQVVVRIGHPFHLDNHGHSHRDSASLAKQTQTIMDKIAELLPSQYLPSEYSQGRGPSN
jgi:1-acyl-sn-glycerol-3-phosphate acyltransferase